MFLLDSLMIDGISWVLRTVTTAAEAEMNDDAALREQLLNAEMQREMGEITEEEFTEIERDLLARIRDIKERRAGGLGPFAFGEGEPIDTTGDNKLQIEASVSGDFHEPTEAPHTTVIEQEPPRRGIIGTEKGQIERVLDVEPLRAETIEEPARPLPAVEAASTRSSETGRASRTKKTTGRQQSSRTRRTTRTTRASKIR
jgi:Gas vesicle protein G